MRYLPLLLLLACGDITGLPREAVPMTPPIEYRHWHSLVADCAGIAASFERIHWFTSDLDGGQWAPPHDILVGEDWRANVIVVQHEILHDLLDGDPHHRHATWARCIPSL